jgi:hypothetical protein
MLDIWLDLPLVIHVGFGTINPFEGLDNILALLEHSHRVRQILLEISSPQLEEVSAAMQVPFPELTNLRLYSYDEMGPVLRDPFLGGSAPCLRTLMLIGISFPGLPRLLLSTTHLVSLHLDDIPHSGYISPETMAIALSTLINLESLTLKFESPRYPPDGENRRPPPPTRTALPVLTCFEFGGPSEYLEDFVARIDVLLLDSLRVTLFDQFVFNTTQFTRFIGRSPNLKASKQACVYFDPYSAWVNLSGCGALTVTVSCRGLERQLLSLERVCTSSLPPVSTSEDLCICETLDWQPNWQDSFEDMPDNFENTIWLGLLRPFIAVKNLYLDEDIVPRIVPALQQAVIGGTRVLPNLQNIFLQELEPSRSIREAIEQFVAARQVTSHPISVSCWERRRVS